MDLPLQGKILLHRQQPDTGAKREPQDSLSFLQTADDASKHDRTVGWAVADTRSRYQQIDVLLLDDLEQLGKYTALQHELLYT